MAAFLWVLASGPYHLFPCPQLIFTRWGEVRNDDKIKYTILLVLFHFYFVVILPLAIGINNSLFADFTPRKKEK